jgi:Icc protein
MNGNHMNRRDFLQIAGMGALGITGLYTPTNAQPLTPERDRKRVLRIAHITDFHLLPFPEIMELATQALRHAQAQEDPPDVFFNTGDSIMDSLFQTKVDTEWQWQGFTDLIQAECHIPIYHAIGNHDVWGWGLNNSKIKKDPLYGKNMAVSKLGLSNRYYSFDLAGWHFIFTDSTYDLPDKVYKQPYIGQYDEEQYQWLVADIQSVPVGMPICIVEHIPILAACEYFDGPNEESGDWVIPAAWVHIDARRLRQLFLEYSNVKLCLSGHTHQYESLDYLGVRYLTDGAICGAWWDGAYLDFPPAYVLVDLYNDGTAQSQFVPYQVVENGMMLSQSHPEWELTPQILK